MAKKEKAYEWTVMVFMAASRDDQGVTEAAAVRDLRELELVGTTPEVSVVVQLDRQWPGGAERYRIHRDGSEPIRIQDDRSDTGADEQRRQTGTQTVPDGDPRV